MAERIVAFLPGWIGDAVMATPALRSLRERFAGARILWVAKSGVAAALQGSPWNDGVIASVPSKGLAKLAEPLALARMIRNQLGGAPDLAVLLSNSMRTGLAGWLSGASRRVGQALHGRRLLLSDAIEPKRDASGQLYPTPIIEIYNEIARVSGCAEPGLAMELFTTRNDESDAVSAWSVAGFRPGIRIVGLHAGAAFGAAKLWPIERFAEVARKLAGMGFGVIVLGGPVEAAQARNLVARADHPMVRALAEPGMPPLSLGLIKAVVRRLALLLTTDSGPRHIASAFNRPVVTLFGPTHIAWTETWQENAVHLAAPVPCGPCQMRVCPIGHHDCMKNIGTSLVIDVIRQVMEGITPLAVKDGVPGVRAFDPPRIALGMMTIAERKSA
ncbi:MAG: glycosyltransferase family 9 protein [Planctomycetota bacterium]|nr:glycosyltransferase family 9 protein [Planctomycetota bacterium]